MVQRVLWGGFRLRGWGISFHGEPALANMDVWRASNHRCAAVPATGMLGVCAEVDARVGGTPTASSASMRGGKTVRSDRTS